MIKTDIEKNKDTSMQEKLNFCFPDVTFVTHYCIKVSRNLYDTFSNSFWGKHISHFDI